MPTIVIIVLGLYAVLDSFTVGMGVEQRPAYAAVFGISCLMLLFAARRPPLPRGVGRPTAIWWGIGIIGLAMILTQDNVYWLYVAGDAASFFYPAVLLSIARRNPAPFCEQNLLKLLGFLLVAASLGAILVMPVFVHGIERFREPPLLLMALGWLGLARPKNIGELAISMIVSVFVLQLTWLSGARLSLMLWPLMGLALFALGHVSKQMMAVAVCMMAFAAVTANVAIDAFDLHEEIESSRMGRFVDRLQTGSFANEVAEDDSMNNRVLEAQDALYTRYDYQGPLEWIFGSGHGATFEGATAEYGDRLLPNGDVHHIHFGLVLMYYRYGVPGVLGFLWLLGAACRRLWLLKRLSPHSPVYYPSLLFSLSAVAYLLNTLLFNALVDPLFAFTIAGFLTTRALSNELRSSQPAMSGRRFPTRQALPIEKLPQVA